MKPTSVTIGVWVQNGIASTFHPNDKLIITGGEIQATIRFGRAAEFEGPLGPYDGVDKKMSEELSDAMEDFLSERAMEIARVFKDEETAFRVAVHTLQVSGFAQMLEALELAASYTRALESMDEQAVTIIRSAIDKARGTSESGCLWEIRTSAMRTLHLKRRDGCVIPAYNDAKDLAIFQHCCEGMIAVSSWHFNEHNFIDMFRMHGYEVSWEDERESR